MDKCTKCRRDLGFGSVIITRVEPEKVHMIHFFCGTPEQVKALYASFKGPVKLPFHEPTRK